MPVARSAFHPCPCPAPAPACPAPPRQAPKVFGGETLSALDVLGSLTVTAGIVATTLYGSHQEQHWTPQELVGGLRQTPFLIAVATMAALVGASLVVVHAVPHLVGRRVLLLAYTSIPVCAGSLVVIFFKGPCPPVFARARPVPALCPPCHDLPSVSCEPRFPAPLRRRQGSRRWSRTTSCATRSSPG